MPAPDLEAFLDAFNAHDVDAIMSSFAEDCVFDMPRGPAPGGRRLVGKRQVSRKDSFWKIVD
jgi:ketosteroid isomerase-like protein